MSKYPKILFWPAPLLPKPFSRVYRICAEYGVPYTGDIRDDYDLHLYWNFNKNRCEPDYFTVTSNDVINRGCYDVSKVKVTKIFDDITLDPEKHVGICVEKHDHQGDHENHRLITCPAPRREGYIYQRYIDNKDGPLFVKHRIYYADGIEYILRQRKRSLFGMLDRLADTVTSEFVNVRSIFTEQQQMQFDSRCRQFGFDYGDADLLIENGNPVIIDINNVVGPHFFGDAEIKRVQDTQFLNFITRRYENSRSNLRFQ